MPLHQENPQSVIGYWQYLQKNAVKTKT